MVDPVRNFAEEAAAEDKCLNCGYTEREHSYNGACYGLCGKFIPKDAKDDYDCIVLRSAIWPCNTYFRYVDHGGPVDNIWLADRVKSIGPDLRHMIDHAVQYFPNVHWQVLKVYFAYSPVNLDKSNEVIDEQVRKEALKKLSDDEKRVLGLK